MTRRVAMAPKTRQVLGKSNNEHWSVGDLIRYSECIIRGTVLFLILNVAARGISMAVSLTAG
jgi:hypothetical protein